MKIELNEQQINAITELMLLGVKHKDSNANHAIAFANIVSYINVQINENKKAQEQQKKVKIEEKAK